MIQVNPYLTFNGNCRDAMNFYRDCFGGELNLQTLGDTPEAYRCSSGKEHHVMHAMLVSEGLVLMASDMIGPEGWAPGNTISLSLDCSGREELETLFTGLSEGGTVRLPLTEMFWGATFGTLTDRYGITWLFNYAVRNTSSN